MTKEEAVNTWLPIIKMGVGKMPECKEALDIAIKALEREPCEDAISRQAVLDIVDSYSESKSNVEDVTQDIISDIMALSSVKQESKTGHWIYKQYDGYPECGDYHCSECDKIDNHIPAYCSYCGAKMNNEVKE